MSLGCPTAPAQQIHDNHDQRHNQQQVDQSSSNVQAEAQEPQNQKYSNNRPKHMNLLVVMSALLLLAQAERR